MQLTVESLRGTGGFAGAPVKKTISWVIGEQEYDAEVYVRRLSYKSAITDAVAISEGGDLPAARISYCIVNDKGDPIFTVADITGVNPDGSPVMDDVDGEQVPRGALHEAIANALYEVILEVNPVGKRKSRNSPKSKSSG